MDTKALRINSPRLKNDFDTLARIGSTGDGGLNRPALSKSHLAARKWFRERIETDGFEFHQDSAGNHSAILRSKSTGARTLMLGSHLDSVPFGGRFDGALGVLAAYEAVRTVRDSGLELPVHLEAMDFTDEEGTLVGLLGSRALAGKLPPEELASPRGGRARLEEGLHRAGLQAEKIHLAARPPDSLAGFLELHIEQGPRLSGAGADIGIVQSIVGIQSFTMRFQGRADHAGTTPMTSRRDAGAGAAMFMVAAREMVMEKFKGCVINFGQIEFKPGAFNIVPRYAELALEYRASNSSDLAALKNALLDLAHQTAGACELQFSAAEQGCVIPTQCAPGVQNAFASACKILGLHSIQLISGAGHDTQAMAQVCPAGMIFIPSKGGSHNPKEFAEWQDCANGANVLLQAALQLTQEKGP